MGWATGHIVRLNAGETIQCRPRGNSMTGRVNDGDLVTIEPIGDRVVEKGDVVLAKVHGKEFLHLVSAVRHGSTYQISNNHGHVNGWVGRNGIFGILTKVEK